MKLFALLSVVFSFMIQPVYASGTGEPILMKMKSAGARPPKYRDSRTVEVFPMGDVRITTVKGLKEKVTIKEPLSSVMMKKIFACAKKMSKARDVKRPNCAGSGLTTYYVGDTMVSIRMCGEVNTSSDACAESMINLLDRL